MTSTLSPSFSLPTVNKPGRNNQPFSSRFVPGPGAYDPKVKTGESLVFNSVYRSPGAKTFYHHDRFPRSSVERSSK